MPTFNYESSTHDVIQGINLSDKTIVITGASAGLGLESTRCLASAGAHIVLAARNPEKIEKAKAHIQASVGNAKLNSTKLSHVLLDLSDLNSVRKAANELLEQKLAIDVLINNAGVMACPFEKTTQGFEMQFGSNHLGHFLFTNMLVPLLKKESATLLNKTATRVICLSSAAHKFAAPNLDDPNYQSRSYNKWQAYGEAKSANALFALTLNERLRNTGIESFSVHPGMIATELGRHLEPEDLLMFSGGSKNKDNKDTSTAKKSDKPKRSPFKSVEQGAATSVWAATSSALTGKGGCYLEDCQIAELSSNPAKGYAAYIADKNLGEKLWTLSENLVGETIAF